MGKWIYSRRSVFDVTYPVYAYKSGDPNIVLEIYKFPEMDSWSINISGYLDFDKDLGTPDLALAKKLAIELVKSEACNLIIGLEQILNTVEYKRDLN